MFSRHNGKWAFRHDLKENGCRDCGIGMVCLKKHQGQNSVWMRMCIDVHMNASAYFTHFTHTHIQISLMYCSLISIQRESCLQALALKEKDMPVYLIC